MKTVRAQKLRYNGLLNVSPFFNMATSTLSPCSHDPDLLDFETFITAVPSEIADFYKQNPEHKDLHEIEVSNWLVREFFNGKPRLKVDFIPPVTWKFCIKGEEDRRWFCFFTVS